MRPSRSICGPISEFDRNVTCSSVVGSEGCTRQMSDCGRNSEREIVGAVPCALPRDDANTIQLPSGDHAGSKSSMLMPLDDGNAGSTRLQLLPLMSTV